MESCANEGRCLGTLRIIGRNMQRDQEEDNFDNTSRVQKETSWPIQSAWPHLVGYNGEAQKILGLYRGYIGIMENKMEATIMAVI